MRTKSKNFIVKIGHYPFDLMVSLGETNDQVFKSIRRLNIDAIDNIDCKFDGDGSVGRVVEFTSGQYLLRLRYFPETAADYGVLQHEIFHVVEFLFRTLRVGLCEETSEVYAYLLQYLSTIIYAEINKK